jgi:hypothetical protein
MPSDLFPGETNLWNKNAQYLARAGTFHGELIASLEAMTAPYRGRMLDAVHPATEARALLAKIAEVGKS